jgi:hypothetical protein
VKNRDLLDSAESINAIAALKQPVRTAFAVGLNLRAIKDHITYFDEQRKKLVDRHTQKDESGEPVPVYAPENGPDGKPLVESDGTAIPVRDAAGKIVNKILNGQIKLVDPKAFQKEMQELLDVDVTEDIKIRLIKLSDLKGDLEPQHFANLIWMFNEDSEKSA